jgi:putative colanic acid biosynthesis acetyltransferase WcaF
MAPRYQDLETFGLPEGTRGRSGFVVAAWQLAQATVFACSPQYAYPWRRWLLRLFGAKVGKGVLVRQSARVTYPWFVSLGDHCWIGDHAEIYSVAPITIGANAVVSQRSYICAGTHNHMQLNFPAIGKPVEIGDEVWVATDCFIGPGVRIGRGAIVAARSTVTADVKEATIVAGNPAEFRGKRIPSRGQSIPGIRDKGRSARQVMTVPTQVNGSCAVEERQRSRDTHTV